MEEERVKVTVGALLMAADGTVLLVRSHKWGNRWSLPGGKIEAGETMHAALKREMREETGLTIDDIQFVCAQESVYSPEFYKRSHQILLNFTARVTTKAVRLNDEAQAYEWVSLENALKKELNEPTRRLIETVLERSA